MLGNKQGSAQPTARLTSSAPARSIGEDFTVFTAGLFIVISVTAFTVVTVNAQINSSKQKPEERTVAASRRQTCRDKRTQKKMCKSKVGILFASFCWLVFLFATLSTHNVVLHNFQILSLCSSLSLSPRFRLPLS